MPPLRSWLAATAPSTRTKQTIITKNEQRSDKKLWTAVGAGMRETPGVASQVFGEATSGHGA